MAVAEFRDLGDMRAFKVLAANAIITNAYGIIAHPDSTQAERLWAFNAAVELAFSSGVGRGIERLGEALRAREAKP